MINSKISVQQNNIPKNLQIIRPKLEKNEKEFSYACKLILQNDVGNKQHLNHFITILSQFNDLETKPLLTIMLDHFTTHNSQDKQHDVANKSLIAGLLFIKLFPGRAFTPSLTHLDQHNFNQTTFSGWCSELDLNYLGKNIPITLMNNADEVALKFKLPDAPLDIPLARFLNSEQRPQDNFMTTFKLQELITNIDTIDIVSKKLNEGEKHNALDTKTFDSLNNALKSERKELQQSLKTSIATALQKTADAHQEINKLAELTQDNATQLIIAIKSQRPDKFNHILTLNQPQLLKLKNTIQDQIQHNTLLVSQQQTKLTQQLTELSTASKMLITTISADESYWGKLQNSEAFGKKSLTDQDNQVREQLKNHITNQLTQLKSYVQNNVKPDNNLNLLQQNIKNKFEIAIGNENKLDAFKSRIDFIKPYMQLLNESVNVLNTLATAITANKNFAEDLLLTPEQTALIQEINVGLAANHIQPLNLPEVSNQHDFANLLQQVDTTLTESIMNNDTIIAKLTPRAELFAKVMVNLQTIKSNEQRLRQAQLEDITEDVMLHSQLHNHSNQDNFGIQNKKLEALNNENNMLHADVDSLLDKIFPQQVDKLNSMLKNKEFVQVISSLDSLENKLSAIQIHLADTIASGKTLIKMCESNTSNQNTQNVLNYLDSGDKNSLAQEAKKIIQQNSEAYSNQMNSISERGSIHKKPQNVFNFNNDYINNQGAMGNCYLIAFLNSAVFNSPHARENLTQQITVNKDNSVTLKLNLIKEFSNPNGTLKDEVATKLDSTKFTKVSIEGINLLITISPEHVNNVTNYGNLLPQLAKQLTIQQLLRRDNPTVSDNLDNALQQFSKQAAPYLQNHPDLKIILDKTIDSKKISKNDFDTLVKDKNFKTFFGRVTSHGIGFKLIESTLSNLASIEAEIRGIKDLNRSVLFFNNRGTDKAISNADDQVMYRLMGYNVQDVYYKAKPKFADEKKQSLANLLIKTYEKQICATAQSLEKAFAEHNWSSQANKPIVTLGIKTEIITGRKGSHGHHAFSILDIKKDEGGNLWLKLVNPWHSNEIAKNKDETKPGFEDYWSLEQLLTKSRESLDIDGKSAPGQISFHQFSPIKESLDNKVQIYI